MCEFSSIEQLVAIKNRFLVDAEIIKQRKPKIHEHLQSILGDIHNFMNTSIILFKELKEYKKPEEKTIISTQIDEDKFNFWYANLEYFDKRDMLREIYAKLNQT